MRIKFNASYKSLTPFYSPDLPHFVVLTGKNGSGKSQLLELMYHKDIFLDSATKAKIPEIQHLLFEDFIPKKIKLTSFGVVGPQGLGAANSGAIATLEKNLISQLPNFRATANYEDKHEFRLLKKICDFNGVVPATLQQDHIKQFRYSGEDFEVKDIFTANLSQIVISYFENFHKNLEMTVAKESYKKDVVYLSAEEFDKKFPNPFHLINNILTEANIDYRLIEEKVEDYYSAKSYEPIFTNVRSGAIVKINDFSSGEKVLISLAFSVLNTTEYSSSSLPNLLLLDEIDASLHPSMVKQLIDVIQNQLVGKHKIKVILTTHSPSTVALSPEASLFLLQKIGDPGDRFIKVDKRVAINQLLDGVRHIDIEIQNIKYVFTEARNDQRFFKEAYSALRNRLDNDVHIEFISSGVYDGDCELVRATVSKLRDTGNKRIFGLIDWDLNNSSSDGIWVHSQDQMYSLENIILSPYFLGMFLLHENIIKVKDVFPDENRSYFELFKNDFKESSLRDLATYVEGKAEFSSMALVSIELVNGVSINLSKDYLYCNGHSLETKLKEKFPGLNRYNNGKLLNESIEKIIRYFPELLPKSLLELLLQIQSS